MSVCTVCARDGRWQANHLTGRDDKDNYLDPDLTNPMCHDHHTLWGDDWYTLEIAEVAERLTLVERVELRLRRLAQGLARIDAGQGGNTLWGSLAAAAASWAKELDRFHRALDEQCPDWRSHPGLYQSGENEETPTEL